MALEHIDRGLPVTIITGFLGSGKTTLVNHILTNNQGIKTAVIVNEFGDIGIDSALIVSTDESMIELDNGCVCCTVRDDLIEATLRILERPNPVDYLIIETTGLADPGPIAMTFMSPQLRPLTRLDGIVGMVDALNYAPDLFTSETAVHQIAYADVILLNKTDEVTPERLEQLQQQIKDIQPEAAILATQNAVVDLRLILDVGVFKLEKYFQTEGADHSDHGHNHHDHDHHDHHHHEHDDTCAPDCGHDHTPHFEAEGFSSVSIELDEPLSVQKLERFLKDLPGGVFRAKGFLWVKESADKIVFHMVGQRMRLDYEKWKTPPKNQVVFIGQHLDKEAIRQGFLDCVSTKAKAKARGFGR
ncbi:CobW family GTP-binding protein [Anthocerotibacter panamensis]|uniref:CobW family GTP-binding protein n=1 Tax=Anthocerotibacter panamensis TaxID=2857077 RepID=UPI001FD9615D|nr:GTP-binding protein [Anthocerotibacter panamensis]